MTNEQMWGYPSQCLNTMVGIRNAQLTRFQAMSREICEKMATLKLSQQLPEHRFVADPDDYDDEWEFDPVGYELFQGMHLDDCPPTSYIPHHRIPPAAFHGPTPSRSVGTVVPSSNVAPSVASTGPVLRFTGFTAPAGFFTCAGLTSEAISDPFDDVP
ncbi:unnamed protein product [Prunus brigantina]